MVVSCTRGGCMEPKFCRPRRTATTGPAGAAWAGETATALGNAGFDLNLAPIADVSTLDSPLSDRAFSDDVRQVTAMTRASVRGCRDKEAVCATPYFPGLGAASQSTSEGPATVSLDIGSLEARDLAPFRAAINENVPGVVVSLAVGTFASIGPARWSAEPPGSTRR